MTLCNTAIKKTHIVFYSSGASSWYATKRVIERYGRDNLYLVFADTLIEDEDNYRFLVEGADKLGVKNRLVWLKDGRSPWELFRDMRYVGNSRIAPCSHKLKQEVCLKWLKACEFDPSATILYLGIDWQEYHRAEAIIQNWQPYQVEFPLCWEPWADRVEVFKEMKVLDLKPPRLYELGFSHANCGGFCVRAGKAQFKKLLLTMRDRYLKHEQEEERTREHLGKDVSVLKDVTLKAFREQIESQPKQLTLFEDWGGCNCFSLSDQD